MLLVLAGLYQEAMAVDVKRFVDVALSLFPFGEENSLRLL